jgi:hypothetical protein
MKLLKQHILKILFMLPIKCTVPYLRYNGQSLKFKEKIYVYSVEQRKHINILCVQNRGLLNVKEEDTCRTKITIVL